MPMLTCMQKHWKVKIVSISMIQLCAQDGACGATYSCRLTSNHSKTEIKKTLNYTVIRKGVLNRECFWLYVLLSVEVS